MSVEAAREGGSVGFTQGSGRHIASHPEVFRCVQVKVCGAGTMDREMAVLGDKMAELAQECEQMEAGRRVGSREVEPTYKVPLEAQQQQQQQQQQQRRSPAKGSVSGRPPAKTPLPAGSESEHIYESIPDASESDEPIYCIPYEPGGTRRRRGLGRPGTQPRPPAHQKTPQPQPAPQPGRAGRGSGTSSSSGGSVRERRAAERKQSVEKWVRENPQPRSPPSTKPSPTPPKPQEERDSSSAYNTGDSTGSTHQPPTLELSLGQDPALRQSTLTLCPPTHDQSLQVCVCVCIYLVVTLVWFYLRIYIYLVFPSVDVHSLPLSPLPSVHSKVSNF